MPERGKENSQIPIRLGKRRPTTLPRQTPQHLVETIPRQGNDRKESPYGGGAKNIVALKVQGLTGSPTTPTSTQPTTQY